MKPIEFKIKLIFCAIKSEKISKKNKYLFLNLGKRNGLVKHQIKKWWIQIDYKIKKRIWHFKQKSKITWKYNKKDTQ